MVILLGIFTYWPLVQTVWLSLVKWSLVPGRPTPFVGVANFQAVVTNPLFEAAARNTVVYLVASSPLKVILPIPIAIFLWSIGPRGHVYRTVLFLPTLISLPVASHSVTSLCTVTAGLNASIALPLGSAGASFTTD
jgi:multiple sugar transport system permease protein/sn-glycerol 3-phosphate transport system permease protein